MEENFFNLSNPYFVGTMVRFVINTIMLFILIRVIYFRYSRKEMFTFTFFLMGITIYFIGSILNSITLEFGMAIGLVAVFTILRFRTRQISIKDMAYMFTVFGISVINSLRMVGFPMLGRLIINILILLSAYVLEEFLFRNQSESLSIVYENLEFLKPDNKEKLMADLSQITGKHILRIKIQKIDYKRSAADIEIYYRD